MFDKNRYKIDNKEFKKQAYCLKIDGDWKTQNDFFYSGGVTNWRDILSGKYSTVNKNTLEKLISLGFTEEILLLD